MSRCQYLGVVTVFVIGFCAGASQAQSQTLNDSGITISGDAASNSTACEFVTSTVQDCHNGRDAAGTAGVLIKVGASALNNGKVNGLDYTKISNQGDDLPPNATLGTSNNDWACTRDNVTGLVWELKTSSGFRGMNGTYSWYNSVSPDGHLGTSNGGTCFNTARCDTEKFVQDVNAIGLCGHSDWRMPSRRELQSIFDYGRSNPAIDPDYFPNSASNYFWSGSPEASNANNAWIAFFNDGRMLRGVRAYAYAVRLVRAGP